jgi:alpha-beta hydrolase superfamily lysophospholipase
MASGPRGGTVAVVELDLLGAPYERRTIDLGSDDEGPVTAVLVGRRSETPTGAAVLYVHGFNDYFFQTHLADFYVERGIDFYALDLRKYGRSLQPHQTANFVRDLQEYYPELDEAVRLIRDEDGHRRLLLNGHSTGGLIIALWAHDRGDEGRADALFFNSPFFDLNEPWAKRKLLTPVASRIGQLRPYLDLRQSLNDVYGRSIHRTHSGEWEYDLAWKPLVSFPVRAGWLRAIHRAQARLHAGLDIRVPILVACSTLSYKRARWGEEAHHADSVLDVDHIARWTPALGRHVTLVRVEGGKHDLTLSRPPVRKQLFAELSRWLGAYFEQA